MYRATDTKLKREVAIKVLPSALASDPDRLARFQREAEVLASLNHPNIAAIYGLEETKGVKALVMELVEGPTLAEIVAGSRLSAVGSRQKSRPAEGPGPRAVTRFHSMKRCPSRSRSPRPSKPRTKEASSTAI